MNKVKTIQILFSEFCSLVPLSVDVCNKYIQKIIGNFGKSNLGISHFVSQIPDMRKVHTISTYLLGIILYENNRELKNNIDRFIKNSIKWPETDTTLEKNRFSFIWMLISIYHDFGYKYESSIVSSNNDTEDKAACLFSHPDPCLYCLNFPEEGKYVPDIYTNKVLRSYARYILFRFEQYDHGIYGGKKLYNDITSNKKVPNGAVRVDDAYACAAWTIAAHNIFYIKSTDAYSDCYCKIGLLDFIYQTENVRKISLQKCPLLYLLSLVDNIEPYKRIPENDIFDRIQLEISESKIQIDASDLTDDEFKKYAKGILGLQSWLTDVSDSNRNLDDPNVSKVIDVSILSSNNNENQNI